MKIHSLATFPAAYVFRQPKVIAHPSWNKYGPRSKIS